MAVVLPLRPPHSVSPHPSFGDALQHKSSETPRAHSGPTASGGQEIGNREAEEEMGEKRGDWL